MAFFGAASAGCDGERPKYHRANATLGGPFAGTFAFHVDHWMDVIDINRIDLARVSVNFHDIEYLGGFASGGPVHRCAPGDASEVDGRSLWTIGPNGGEAIRWESAGPLTVHCRFLHDKYASGRTGDMTLQGYLGNAAGYKIAASPPGAPSAATAVPALQVVAKGRTLKPLLLNKGWYTFMLPKGATEARIASRLAVVPDTGPHGVRIVRIRVRDGEDWYDIPMDHPGLVEGWGPVERFGTDLCRWTNGDALLVLPQTLGAAILELEIGGAFEERMLAA
jgi:hypothetical protein